MSGSAIAFASRLARLSLLTLLGLSGAATPTHPSSDPAAAHHATLLPSPLALDQVLAEANFSYDLVASERYDDARRHTEQQLRTLGFSPLWQRVMATETVSAWYSPTLSRTVICTETSSSAGMMHQAVVIVGKVSRREVFL